MPPSQFMYKSTNSKEQKISKVISYIKNARFPVHRDDILLKFKDIGSTELSMLMFQATRRSPRSLIMMRMGLYTCKVNPKKMSPYLIPVQLRKDRSPTAQVYDYIIKNVPYGNRIHMVELAVVFNKIPQTKLSNILHYLANNENYQLHKELGFYSTPSNATLIEISDRASMIQTPRNRQIANFIRYSEYPVSSREIINHFKNFTTKQIYSTISNITCVEKSVISISPGLYTCSTNPKKPRPAKPKVMAINRPLTEYIYDYIESFPGGKVHVSDIMSEFDVENPQSIYSSLRGLQKRVNHKIYYVDGHYTAIDSTNVVTPSTNENTTMSKPTNNISQEIFQVIQNHKNSRSVTVAVLKQTLPHLSMKQITNAISYLQYSKKSIACVNGAYVLNRRKSATIPNEQEQNQMSLFESMQTIFDRFENSSSPDVTKAMIEFETDIKSALVKMYKTMSV